VVYGEIKKPENHHTAPFKPERDGLFCARNLRADQGLRVPCGKYTHEVQGIICEKCSVEVTLSRSGASAWATSNCRTQSPHLVLKSCRRAWAIARHTLKDLERILYFEYSRRTRAGSHSAEGPPTTGPRRNNLRAQDEYGQDSYHRMIGAEAIRELPRDSSLKSWRRSFRAKCTDRI